MKKRRHLTLLEVLIAMSIVIFSALPLIAPHVAMYREQKELVGKVEMDRKVQNWFAQVYEDLLLGKMALPDESAEAFEGAVYSVREIERKGSKTKAHLYELTVDAQGQKYHYHVAIRDEKEEADSHTD
jgi:Tfp pilus assembly protein PilV